MKYLVIFITIFLLGSCMPSGYDNIINNLECPVILHSKSESGVIIQDNSGDILYISGGFEISKILNNTFNVGDTIRFCK